MSLISRIRATSVIVSSLTLLCSMGLISKQDAAARPAAKDVWLLTQVTEEQGQNDVKISQDAVHVYCRGLGYHLSTRAPDWQVHCYRTDERLEWKGAMSQFTGLVMANPFNVPKSFDTPNCTVDGKGNLIGLKYTRYSTGPGTQNQLFVSDEIHVAPKVGEFLARYYYVPNTKQVPIYRSTRRAQSKNMPRVSSLKININSAEDLRGGTIVKLKTTAWQKIPYKASDFEIPAGLKQVPDIIQVSYSANRKTEVNEMLDSIGFTDESNKLTKSKRPAK